MKKIIAFLVCFLLTTNDIYAQNNYEAIQLAVEKYKEQNYIGCMQDMTDILEYDPSNILAHYYLAISLVKIGDSAKAIEEYKAVINLNTSGYLSAYSRKGIVCLETPDKCKEKTAGIGDISKSVTDKVDKMMQIQNLEKVKGIINQEKDVDTETLEKLEEFPAIQQEEEPTEEEIQNAMKLLKKAGINNPAYNYEMNSEMMQTAMLMNSLGSNNNNSYGYMGMNNNPMMSLMMLQQDYDNGKKIDPKVIQTMVSGMMMPDMGLFSNDDKN
ncbi:MAG: hypothetical protein PHV68_08050 [Candidatus Gastranaerophilales bacterium]|nr:hypothetical protein [Candidatus Gastranaerophilales bacterium]